MSEQLQRDLFDQSTGTSESTELVLDVRGAGPLRGKAPTHAPPRRTVFYEDDLHVATVIEYAGDRKSHAFCMWSVAFDGGRADSYVEAEKKIRQQLSR